MKILTREERLKKTYNDLYALNQKLKLISEIYYIDPSGVVYMKSLVPFLESVVTLNYRDKFESFYHAAILPNKLFDFGKRVKKSKMKIEEIQDKEGQRFQFYQTDFPDLTYTLKILSLEKEYIQKSFNYKRMFEITDAKKYEIYEDSFYPLDVSQVEDLVDSKFIEVYLPSGDMIPLTKHIFLDIKKTDYIQIRKVARQRIEGPDDVYRTFYIICHDTDLYTKYTLFNRLSY